MMKRMMMVVAMAAAAAAMVLLTAPAVVAQGVTFDDYCAEQGSQVTIGSGPPTCTFTQKTPRAVSAQHGFTLTTEQLVSITLPEYAGETANGGNPTPTPVPGSSPTIVSCQNPGGKDVPLSNPNCTPAA
jgi:hypothetical protein